MYLQVNPTQMNGSWMGISVYFSGSFPPAAPGKVEQSDQQENPEVKMLKSTKKTNRSVSSPETI